MNDLNSRLEKSKDGDGGRSTFQDAVQQMNDQLEKDKLDAIEKAQKGGGPAGANSGAAGSKEWSTDELALLIKAG